MSVLIHEIEAITNRSSDSPYYFSVPNNFLADRVVESILKLPYEHFIEGIPTKPIPQFRNYAGFLPDINLSITTSSCYKIFLAQAFASTLSKRFKLNNKRNDDISTCLQEAISNAILHGNLQVKSNFRTIYELCQYQNLIEERLTVSTYSKRRVNIAAWNNPDHLEITVSDEGNGFDLENNYKNNQFPNGRGLMLIHTFADIVKLADDKKTLSMTFIH